jgi:tetratricopeptide (TPR) repeat protein
MRARLLWSQSRLHDAKGESDLAAAYARRAVDILDATEHTQYAARAHQLLAHVENDRGHPAEALQLLEEGYSLLNGYGNPFERATFKLEEARALAQLGERERAVATALEVTALLRDTSPSDAGRAFILAAEVFEQLGERERARELYELAIEEMPAHGRYRADAYTRLAGLLEAEGRTEEALALLKRAMGAPDQAHRLS